MLLAGDFAKTEAQATLLQKRINSIKNDALKGGLLLGAGVGMLALFKAPLEEAKKFEQQVGKFKLFGSRSDKYRQAGNGIPPQMMEAVCKAVSEAINGSVAKDKNNTNTITKRQPPMSSAQVA